MTFESLCLYMLLAADLWNCHVVPRRARDSGLGAMQAQQEEGEPPLLRRRRAAPTPVPPAAHPCQGGDAAQSVVPLE